MSYYRQKTKGRLGVSPGAHFQPYTFPPSVGGINGRDAVTGMPPQDCLYCHNLMPVEYGLRLRKGYREWANIPTGKKVNTIIPFEGQESDASGDRLWAVTEDGIYDITLFNTTAPVLEVDWTGTPPTTGEQGFGVWSEFTNDADNRFLQYADAERGLYEYSEDTQAWTVPSLTGPVVDNIAFVTTWKNRFWYIEQDSASAWYLAPDSNSGNCTKFTFGSKFTHGGELKALYNWTIDGGNGVDDFLIAIGRGGDVLVYQGSDPSQPDFGLVGSFFIGEVPESRRLAVDYGGELYILSTYGIISIRDLLQGVAPLHPEQSPSAKINRFLRADIQKGKDEFNWALNVHPADGFLQVVTPYSSVRPQDAIQYNQNLVTRAWGMWQGVPTNCADTWNDNYYMGDLEGSIWLYDGEVDGTTLAGAVGEAIEFDILTSFQAPGGQHANYKNVGFIRTIGVLAGTANINVKAVYDYAVETTLVPPTAPPATGANVWDSAQWDVDLWDFTAEGVSLPLGSLGIGRAIAIGMRGSAITRINIVGGDLSFTSGGFL